MSDPAPQTPDDLDLSILALEMAVKAAEDVMKSLASRLSAQLSLKGRVLAEEMGLDLRTGHALSDWGNPYDDESPVDEWRYILVTQATPAIAEFRLYHDGSIAVVWADGRSELGCDSIVKAHGPTPALTYLRLAQRDRDLTQAVARAQSFPV